MKKLLTNEDYCRASKRLKIGVAEIKAVAEVESRFAGFGLDGNPTILFERHKFHKYTGGKFDKTHPDLSSKTPGGYGKSNIQWAKYEQAYSLNPVAAMMSCSWGKFQIMGFNFALCGFTTVYEFVEAMKQSEGEQLLAFVEFLDHAGLTGRLRDHEWAFFSAGYNGKDYFINAYDIKLEKAYAKFKVEKINCNSLELAAEPQIVTPDFPVITSPDTPAESDGRSPVSDEWTGGAAYAEKLETDNQTVDVPQISAEREPDKQPGGIQAYVIAIGTAATALGGFVRENDARLIYALIAVGVIWFVARYLYKAHTENLNHNAREAREKRAQEIQLAVINSAARKDLNNVRVVPTKISNSEADSSVNG